MSTTNPVGGGTYTNTATDATQAARANAELDKTQFLTLLVAQLENQDPMNPIDNQDFIAQLATFSSLEQLISINEGMTRLADAIAPSGDTQ